MSDSASSEDLEEYEEEDEMPSDEELEEDEDDMDYEEVEEDDDVILPHGLEDQLEGGIGDETDPATLDPKEYAMGEKVEMEHTNDPKLAREIARDHLTEDPKYYTHLKEMEDKANRILRKKK